MTSAPAAAPQRPLLQLPTELVHEIALHLSPADLCHLESSCRRLFDCIRCDETLWRALAERRWGPLQKTGKDWRSVLCWLETDVLRTVLRTSVRRAIDMMALAGLLASAGAWTVCVRRLLDWTTLASRRRLAAFVCADWQPREMFRSFLELFDLRAPTPEAALRQLLFAFPFLPIDAGSGADRVIGEFARQYVISNPRAVREMRLGGRVLDELPSSSVEGDDGHVLDKYAGVDRLARDGVYALLYSVIMLNTDLNNPAISPKISLPEYVASCHRCTPLRDVPEPYLRQVYTSIVRAPLRISSHLAGAGSTSPHLAQEGSAAEEEAASALRMPADAAPLSDAELAAATAAAARGRAAAREPPSLGSLTLSDWKVAYWNLLDLGRWCSSRARAAVVRTLVAARAFMLGALVAAFAWALLHWALLPPPRVAG